ncbi:MAG TPA: hypothetical protein VG326_00700 [Tepidisphaeraceae bacterium]|jgi:hypothetical protein|nr:hypothetical protein [Tepidisphaeraceae bacterium]
MKWATPKRYDGDLAHAKKRSEEVQIDSGYADFNAPLPETWGSVATAMHRQCKEDLDDIAEAKRRMEDPDDDITSFDDFRRELDI